MTRKHYCILVHGTWGYEGDPEPKSPPWYALDSQFTAKVNRILLDGESAGWEVRNFVWPECGNKHEHRVAAAARLAAEIEHIRREDPDGTIHFVAHSHGGNVVLEAISRWLLALHWNVFTAFTSALDQVIEDRKRRARRAKEKPDDSLKEAPSREEMRSPLERALEGLRIPGSVAKDLIENMASVPEKNSVSFGIAQILRSLDVGLLDSVSRPLRRKQVWSDLAADLWVAHPAVHGIGRVVFLGTPFLQKRWDYNRRTVRRAVDTILRVLGVTVDQILYIYVVCAFVALFALGWDAWDVRRWPVWEVPLAIFMAVAVASTIPRTLGTRYRDTNLYFDVGSGSLRRIATAIRDGVRIPCFVISAGLLDEALIGTSTEPVIQGAFRPQLRRLVGLSSEGGSPSGPFSADDVVDVSALLKALGGSGTVSGHIRDRLSKGFLETAMNDAASGTDQHRLAERLAQELNRLVGGPSLHTQSAFDKVRLREITRELVKKAPQRKRARSALNRLLLEDAFPTELRWDVRVGTAGLDWSVATPGLLFRLVRLLLWPFLFVGRHLKRLLTRFVIGPIAERVTLRLVRKVAGMTALGVPESDLTAARIEVSEHIEASDVFQEYFWDLTRAAIAFDPFVGTARTPDGSSDNDLNQRRANRLAFLLPSETLPKVESKAHFLYGSLLDQGVKDERMLKTALVIDERIREATGAIGLVHASYHGNDDVTKRLALFLKTGERPVDAKSPDPCDGASTAAARFSGSA